MAKKIQHFFKIIRNRKIIAKKLKIIIRGKACWRNFESKTRLTIIK